MIKIFTNKTLAEDAKKTLEKEGINCELKEEIIPLQKEGIYKLIVPDFNEQKAFTILQPNLLKVETYCFEAHEAKKILNDEGISSFIEVKDEWETILKVEKQDWEKADEVLSKLDAKYKIEPKPLEQKEKGYYIFGEKQVFDVYSISIAVIIILLIIYFVFII